MRSGEVGGSYEGGEEREGEGDDKEVEDDVEIDKDEFFGVFSERCIAEI